MSGRFSQALNVAFTFALVACLIAAGASLLRGGRYHDEESAAPRVPRQADVGDTAARAALASSPAD
jgi:hypothetical protein